MVALPAHDDGNKDEEYENKITTVVKELSCDALVLYRVCIVAVVHLIELGY